MDQLAPEDLVEEASDLSAESLASGSRLGRYELLLPVAYGGMARVWAARQLGQRGFSKAVAIKTILPHLSHSPEFERMFLDEARIASGVRHPNVTEIYELGEEGQVLYLAMEWVSGDSLALVLRPPGSAAPSPVEPRLAARILADACAGLHAAHELCDDSGRLLNVVHRDVSPHNILVSLEGTVKVTDFGVARALGQTHQATMAGQVKGKVAYMAPEQIGGDTFDRRADIFGMGCVLYEATTGLKPFRGAGDPQVMQAVLRGTYDAPGRIVNGYPGELAAIIECALAPEPRSRFATAERMRVALEEWLARGGLVTGTQLGGLVRTRLGPVLDRRRDQIKAATTALHGPDSLSTPGSPGAGHTPSSGSRPGQSHSGVIPMGMGGPPPWPSARSPAPPGPFGPPQGPPPIGPGPVSPFGPPSAGPRSGVPFAPASVPGGPHGAAPYGPSAVLPFGYPAPQAQPIYGYVPPAAPSQPSAPSGQSASGLSNPVSAPELPYGPRPSQAAPAPSGARYFLAALAGVAAAVLVGAVTLMAWSTLHRGPAPALGASASPGALPPPEMSQTPSNAAAPPAPAPATPSAVSAPAAPEAPAPVEIDPPEPARVPSPPTPRPAPPPPQQQAAPRPVPPAPAPARPAVIPANPY